MKIRKLFMTLLISGLSLGSAAAQTSITDSAPATAASASRNASRHIGDAAPAVAASGVQNKYQLVQYDPAMQQLAPSSTGYDPGMQSYDLGSSCGCGSGSCGSSCGTSCGSSCGCGGNKWFGAETLLWWGQPRQTPPLLTTSASPTLPIAGFPGVTTEVGGAGAPIDHGIMPGYRLSGGMYLGCDKQFGISGRVFGLYRSTETISRTSDGTTAIGLPFYDTSLLAPVPPDGAYLVAYNPGNAPVITGTASITSRLDLIAAEPSLRFLVSNSCDHQIDLLGGYTFLRLKDSLTIATDSFSAGPAGDRTTRDIFSADNHFHGGHLGLESSVTRQRVKLSMLSKVSFGNMHQEGTIAGLSTSTNPAAIAASGVYAQTSNIGSAQQDQFAFIPELGIKSSLNIRSNLSVSAGYTFLFISKVALAGKQIDPMIDFTQNPLVANPNLHPEFNFQDGSMWFQGIDLGLNYSF